MPIERIFISVKEAAESLSLSTWKVYALCQSGALESVKDGTKVLIRPDSVREYADNLPRTTDAA